MIKDVKELKECPECGSTDITIVEEKNQLVCKSCGLVYEPMAKEREEQFEKAMEE